jgi:hypothetical protein
MNEITTQNAQGSQPEDDAGTMYNVRQTPGTKRFRLTVPKKLLLSNDIMESRKVGFRPVIDKDGVLTLVYTTDLEAAQKEITLSFSNTGVVSIPSVFATATGLGDATVSWTASDTEDGGVEFHGRTDVVLPEVEPQSARLVEHETLDWREQADVEYDGRSWSQEQFRRYFTNSEREDLGWETNQQLRLDIKRRGTRPALVFTPVDDVSTVPANLVKRAGPTTPGQSDAMLYIPNDTVRALGLVGAPLMWLDDGGSLIAVCA